MTTFQKYRERTRDIQDHMERHVWGEQKYIEGAGSIIKVKGTGSEDEETAVLNIAGNSFNLPKDTDTEVILLSGGSDTMLKLAVLTIPRDKQRRWMEGHGGVQHPTDPEFALDFSDKMAHLTQNKFGVGKDGEFEVKEKEAYFRTDTVKMKKDLHVVGTIYCDNVVSGPQPPPGFEGSKQAEAEKASQASFDFDDPDQ